MPGRDDGPAAREPAAGQPTGGTRPAASTSAASTSAAKDAAARDSVAKSSTGKGSAAKSSAGAREGAAVSGREPGGRTRPAAGSRDRERERDRSAAQRRPSTARRPARAGRRSTARSIRMHGLLGLASTRRAAVLALVVCALVLSVAVPLRNYLAQRGALEDTVRQQDTLREQVDDLERRKAQLSDPAQIEVEARDRLRYVRPGETPYVVQLPTPTAAGPPPTDAPRSADGRQWYGEMWKSIAGADG